VTSPRAWESADRDALIALLTDDVFISMPPMPFDYEGPDAEGTRADGAGGHGLSRFARRNPTSTNPMRPSVGEGAVEEPAARRGRLERTDDDVDSRQGGSDLVRRRAVRGVDGDAALAL